MNNLEWDLVRSFLSVARMGSLSAAARELGVSQPTLSRNIQAIESKTELNLFQRTTQGLTLTEAGADLVDAAAKMNDAAELFNRQVSGLSERLDGDIRLSVNDIVGNYLLPPAIAAFRQQHAGIHIEIVITNHASSINKREADIALRMFRPTQPDLIANRLPDMPLGFFASSNYLKEYGIPKSFEEFPQHILIGFDESTEFIDGAKQRGVNLERKNFSIRTDHLLAQINLCRAGAGIVATHVELAKRCPELQQVLEWVPLPALEFWIVCHSDTQHSSKIRALRHFLTEWFKEDPYEFSLL